MTWGKSLIWWTAAVVLGAAVDAPAHAEARITGLADVSFGTIVATGDQSISQSVIVCSYSGGGWFTTLGYSVRANGSGSGGAFLLSSGAATLAYEVQWADSPNQTGGTMLQSGVLSSGFGNAANRFGCRFLQQDTATLTVTIRAAQLGATTAGDYAGTLQITIVPE